MANVRETKTIISHAIDTIVFSWLPLVIRLCPNIAMNMNNMIVAEIEPLKSDIVIPYCVCEIVLYYGLL